MVDDLLSIEVLLFARASELARARSVTLKLPKPVRVGDVRKALALQVPALTPYISQLLFAVGHEFATAETIIEAGVEVACFPPVSGG